jgi:hypothetical protein
MRLDAVELLFNQGISCRQQQRLYVMTFTLKPLVSLSMSLVLVVGKQIVYVADFLSRETASLPCVWLEKP